MERFKITQQDSLLCKFGPGGDYTTEWKSPATGKKDEKISPLGHVLNAIAEIIGATVQPEILTEIACALPVASEAEVKAEQPKPVEKKEDDPKPAHHPKTAKRPSAGSKLSAEPMLFGDDWGIGSKLKYQPHHRVRTHRKSSRKKTAHQVDGQSTLFEINRRGRKTA